MATRKSKEVAIVNELSADLDSLVGRLKDTFDLHKSVNAQQEAIIEKAKAMIEINTREMDKAKSLAKRIGVTLQ